MLAQIQLTKWKIIRKDGCRIINCPTNSKNHNCQHKQKTVNRAIPKGILQNHQLPYKRSKRKLLFSMNHRTPRKRQQIIRFGYTVHTLPCTLYRLSSRSMLWEKTREKVRARTEKSSVSDAAAPAGSPSAPPYGRPPVHRARALARARPRAWPQCREPRHRSKKGAVPLPHWRLR